MLLQRLTGYSRIAGLLRRKGITLNLNDAQPLLQDNPPSCNEKTPQCQGLRVVLLNIQSG